MFPSPPDDAAAPPHKGDATVVEVPVVYLGCLPQQHEALSVGDDLGGVEGLANVLHKLRPVALELDLGWSGKVLGGLDTFVLQGRQTAGKDRFT